jgi:tetratricopeptide (TPR) repeat protein
MLEAYSKSKTASDERGYTEVIDLAREAMQAGLKGDNAAYARQLMAWGHNRRGEVRAKIGKEKEALEDFQAAIELDGNLWRAIHNRGVSYATLGDYQHAVEDFNRTLELNPRYPNAWFNRGELRYEQRDFQGAVSDYSQAIQLAPGDAAAYNSRGHAYYRLGQYRSALRDYSSAVGLEPRNAAAYTNRGDAYADQGYYAQAADDYRTAVQFDEKLGRAYQSAAWLMATCPQEQYRNAELALESAQKAIELDGDADYRYLETLAAAQASAGKFDEAQETQKRVIKLAPKSDAERHQARLELYRRGVPYREGMESRTGSTTVLRPRRR